MFLCLVLLLKQVCYSITHSFITISPLLEMVPLGEMVSVILMYWPGVEGWEVAVGQQSGVVISTEQLSEEQDTVFPGVPHPVSSEENLLRRQCLCKASHGHHGKKCCNQVFHSFCFFSCCKDNKFRLIRKGKTPKYWKEIPNAGIIMG